ncbi:MAG: class I SAM-dependent methyltransferase [Proteobacteria bacterium]|nr:class I SAM-dependent methyltransferase [Pseudomonadota bacterium]
MAKPEPGSDNEATASFGYREVPKADKRGLVRDVFESVAGRYDLMNDLMSAGIHRLWKAALIRLLKPTPSMHLLDVAGGTGDVAQRFRQAGGGRVTVVDLTPEMLSHGRARAVDAGLLDGIDWAAGDAEALPLADRSVDAYSIAFGLRNVTEPETALGEAHRVLRPGGRLAVLEFSPAVLPGLSQVYDLYSFRVLPLLGGLVAGDAGSYRYLAESIRRFPRPEVLAEMIQRQGFAGVRLQAMTGGIAALHSGWRV